MSIKSSIACETWSFCTACRGRLFCCCLATPVGNEEVIEVRRQRQSRYLEKLFSLFLDVEEKVFSSEPGNGLASPQKEAGLSYFCPWPLPPPTFLVKGASWLGTYGFPVLMALSLVVVIRPVRGRRFLVSVEGLRLWLCACARLVGGLFGRSAKGLARLLVVRVFWPRSRDSRGDLCESERGGRFSDEKGFLLALSLCSRSSNTLEMSLTFSSLVSCFHSWTLRASGPKRSLLPTDMTSKRSLSRWGRSTVGEWKTVRWRSMWRWVKSSVDMTPPSWAMRWASRAIELALWIRSSTKVISFWILFLAGETLRNRVIFCKKLYTPTIEVADMDEVWEDLAAKASSQEGYFVVSESGTSITAVDCGGRSIRGDEACKSHRFGIVEGILWVVGKSLGINSLSHGFRTGGGGHWLEVPDLGCGPCWYRPKVPWITLLLSLRGGHWRWILSCFFFSSSVAASSLG